MNTFDTLITDINACTICESKLAHGVRPVFQAHPNAKILIAGQAPGSKVHQSGVPFDDASGDRLRKWLGVSREDFYNEKKVAIVPMGFCYPGTGKNGDLPPRPECEPAWRKQLLESLPNIETTLVLGTYAQNYHLGDKAKSLTERVKSWEMYWPDTIPIPHPSPRNNRWLSKNPWFEKELIPKLQKRIAYIFSP